MTYLIEIYGIIVDHAHDGLEFADMKSMSLQKVLQLVESILLLRSREYFCCFESKQNKRSKINKPTARNLKRNEKLKIFLKYFFVVLA